MKKARRFLPSACLAAAIACLAAGCVTSSYVDQTLSANHRSVYDYGLLSFAPPWDSSWKLEAENPALLKVLFVYYPVQARAGAMPVLEFGSPGTEGEAAAAWQESVLLRSGREGPLPAIAEEPLDITRADSSVLRKTLYRFEAPYRGIVAGQERQFDAAYRAVFFKSPNGKFYYAVYMISPLEGASAAMKALSRIAETLVWKPGLTPAQENTVLYRSAEAEWERLIPKARYEDVRARLEKLRAFLGGFFKDPALTVLPDYLVLFDEARAESYNRDYELYGEGFDRDRVLGLYGKILERRPSFVDARWGRLGLFLYAGDREAALAETGAILEIVPYDAKAWLEKGKILEAMKKPDEARGAYEKALDLWTGQEGEKDKLRERIGALKKAGT